jgi:hypothetical protein
MTLEKLSGGVDFVQDTAPPASDAVDGDVFLDTSDTPPRLEVFDASAGAFVRPQTGIDWNNKTPQADRITNTNQLSVSGSGYIVGVAPDFAGSITTNFELAIDGTSIIGNVQIESDTIDGGVSFPLYHRFESSFTINETASGEVIITYVLD